MGPWIINAPWQNFSSMYREATTAKEVGSGLERTHHLTAALYFSVSALEAFINEQTRAHLQGDKSEDEIQNILRFGSLRGKRKDPSLIDKLKNWPSSILGKPVSLGTEVMTRIERFIEIRHDLTHPKRRDNEIYRTLEEIESGMVVATVAEYIAQFHSAQGTCFPYWLWGWNYLNPRHGDYEIVLVNDQQFIFSMMALGDPVRASFPQESEAWKGRYMNGYAGYCTLAARLDSLAGCEPKDIRFPHKPVLCRRWWLPGHHLTCGNVTAASIEAAKRHYREVK